MTNKRLSSDLVSIEKLNPQDLVSPPILDSENLVSELEPQHKPPTTNIDFEEKLKKLRLSFGSKLNSSFFGKIISDSVDSSGMQKDITAALNYAEKEIQALRKDLATVRQIIDSCSILYYLGFNEYASFTELHEKLRISRKNLALLLKELQDLFLIQEIDRLLIPKVDFKNKVLSRVKGEKKKNKYYGLNKNNSNTLGILEDTEDFISPSVKKIAKDSKKSYEIAKKQYISIRSKEMEIAELKDFNKKSRFEKIKSLLRNYQFSKTGRDYSFQELKEVVCLENELISVGKWVGKQAKKGDTLREDSMFLFMIKKRILKQIDTGCAIVRLRVLDFDKPKMPNIAEIEKESNQFFEDLVFED